MSTTYPTARQYAPLRTPGGWSGEERRFVAQLSELFDDLYARFNRLRFEDLGRALRQRMEDSEGNLASLEMTTSGVAAAVNNNRVEFSAQGLEIKNAAGVTVFRQDNELGNLMITGNLAASSGTIGGFSIGEDKLYNGTSIELSANGYVRLGGLSVTDGADTGSALEGEGGLTLGAEKARYLILGEGSIRAAFPVRAGCGLFVDPADVTTNAPNAYIDPDTGRVYRSVYGAVSGATSVSATVGADRATATAGTTLTVSGTAGGGTGEYSYTFAASRDNGAYQTLAGSGAARSFYLAQTGLYRFRLEVTDSAGGAFTAYSSAVTVTPAALAAQITCNKSNMTPGGTVTWTANATGGSGTYGYAFVVYQNGASIGGATSGASSFTRTLTDAGTYSAQVTVTDSEGGLAVGAGAAVTVNAATQYARTTGTNVRIRTGPGTVYGIVTTVAAEGSYVQITAGAAGGWYPVYWNGYTGYMSAEYLQFT